MIKDRAKIANHQTYLPMMQYNRDEQQLSAMASTVCVQLLIVSEAKVNDETCYRR